jgi:uncharacterized membrane protein YjgN (DUF898 family)
VSTETGNTAAATALPMGHQIKQPIIFTGTGTEYAKIYFVNLALSILTLGIYSAWAKVRNKRYFYGNTLLAQSSFEYHASPMQILKGRLLVVGLFVLYNVLSGAAPVLAGIMFLGIFAALPWLILKATQFNMRNSSYRQIRFDFKGDVGEMFGLYVILPIASVFTLWLAYPYAAYKQKHYFANRTHYGKSAFSFNGSSKEFFFTYYKALLGVILFFILIGFFIGSEHTRNFVDGFKKGFTEKFEQQTHKLHYVEPQPQSIRLENLPQQTPPQTQQPTPTLPKSDVKKDPKTIAFALAFIAIVYGIIILFSLVVMTYINTRLTNYVFNNLKLNYMRFSSQISYWKLMWIYLTNTIFIFLTLGIFIPWAKVRAVKYKLSCMSVYALNLDTHIAAQNEQVRAVGEEFSDFLDVDVGF